MLEPRQRDEHLAWALDAWLSGQLGAAARAEIAAVRRAAATALIAGLAAEPDDPSLRALGVPPTSVAAGLAAALGEALWAA